MSQLKELQDENRRLKKMYADAQLSAELLKEAMAKMYGPPDRGSRRRAVCTNVSGLSRVSHLW